MKKTYAPTLLVSELKRHVCGSFIFIFAMIIVLVLINQSYLNNELVDGVASKSYASFIPFFAMFAVFIASILSVTLVLDYERGYVKFLLSFPVSKYSLLLSKIVVSFLFSIFFFSCFVLQYVASFLIAGAPLGKTMLICILISYAAVSVVLLSAIGLGLFTSVVFKSSITSITFTFLLLMLWTLMPGPIAEQVLATVVIGEFKREIFFGSLSPQGFLDSTIQYINITNPSMWYLKRYYFIASSIGFLMLSVVAIALIILSMILFRRAEIH